MLTDYNEKLEVYLNEDQELQRRLQGFKNFSGVPNGHYKRAREQGVRAIDRAVRCYPFGGESQIKDGDIIGINFKEGSEIYKLSVSVKNGQFVVKDKAAKNPHLKLAFSKDIFKNAILGRYRWVWLFGHADVKLEHSSELPHSDWITILEILVAMQELVEFDPEMWKKVESL